MIDIDGAIAESEARIGQPMTPERLDWFREHSGGDGIRLVPAATMRELVAEIDRLDRQVDDLLDAQRPATTRPGDLPAALPAATAEGDRSVP